MAGECRFGSKVLEELIADIQLAVVVRAIEKYRPFVSELAKRDLRDRRAETGERRWEFVRIEPGRLGRISGRAELVALIHRACPLQDITLIGRAAIVDVAREAARRLGHQRCDRPALRAAAVAKIVDALHMALRGRNRLWRDDIGPRRDNYSIVNRRSVERDLKIAGLIVDEAR